MTTIIGVDFSGGKADNKTWMAKGRLTEGNALQLDSVQPVLRRDLYEQLLQVGAPAVVAMDFPFGVPAAFAKYLCRDAQPSDLPDVWRIVANMDKASFTAARDDFVDANRELKRYGDEAYYPESLSPLKSVRPNMVPMTYEGICLLHRWHRAYQEQWYVPPLPPASAESREVTVLEVMPGAILKVMVKALGLLPRGHKLYKGESDRAVGQRTHICDGLAKAAGVELPNLKDFRNGCRANDDCLDAIVAAVGAAMWAQDYTRFRRPSADQKPDAGLLEKLRWPAEYGSRTELDTALLEGWLYTPC